MGPTATSDGTDSERAAAWRAQQSGNPSRIVEAGAGGQCPRPGPSAVGAVAIGQTAKRPAPRASAAVSSNVRRTTGRATDPSVPRAHRPAQIRMLLATMDSASGEESPA